MDMAGNNSTDLFSIPADAQVQTYDIIFNISALMVLGALGVFSNIFVLIVIQRSKDLQTPCFLLISGDCICSIALAAGKFWNAVQEAAHFTGVMSVDRSPIVCYVSKTMTPSWAIIAGSMITVLISLDRLISILWPLKYRQLGKRYAYWSLAFCYVFASGATFAGLESANEVNEPVVPCYNFFVGFTPSYLQFFGVFNLIFCSICVLFYGLMLACFEYRRRRMAVFSSDASLSNFLKQQMACMPVIKLLMAFYTIVSVTPELTLTVLLSYEAFQPYLVRSYYYGSVVKVSTSLGEIFALAIGSRQFREGARRVLGGKETAFSVVRLNRSSAIVGSGGGGRQVNWQ